MIETELNTIGLAILVFSVGIFYSFLINISYGHQTFWRDIDGLLTPLQSELFPRSLSKTNVISLMSLVMEKIPVNHEKCSESLRYKTESLVKQVLDPVRVLNSDLIHHMLCYLSVGDLCTSSMVDKRWRSAAEQRPIWECQYQRLLQAIIRNQKRFCSSSMSGSDSLITFAPYSDRSTLMTKAQFCEQYFHLREAVLTSSRQYQLSVEEENTISCRVLLNGDIYDLTSFLDDHPGGAQILQEWNGQDASFIFSLASHSRYALQRAESFMIWSSRRLLKM